MNSNIFLSVCIPTYNRGAILYENLTKMLQDCKDLDIEFVVSDNCSTDNTQELIQGIEDTRVSYYKNDENIVHLNLMKVLSEAKGSYCMLLSDEDFINFSKMSKVRKLILKNRSASLIKLSVYNKVLAAITYTNGNKRACSLFEKYKIVRDFAYMSGIIFNRNYIAEIVDNLDYYNWKRTLDVEFGAYPQMYLSFKVLERGDVITYSDLIIIHMYEAKLDLASHRITNTFMWEPKNRYEQSKFAYGIYRQLNLGQLSSRERVMFYADELKKCINLMTGDYYQILFSYEIEKAHKKNNPEALKYIYELRKQKNKTLYYTIMGYKMIKAENQSSLLHLSIIDYIKNIDIVCKKIIFMIIKSIVKSNKVYKEAKKGRI